jgi:DNA-binding response OmpR family regulator
MNEGVILLVEDDEDLSLITTLQLQERGYQVLCAKDGKSTLELLGQSVVDLILLDVMLPDCTGHDLCKRIREQYEYPIIFMTCLSDSDTIVQAFRNGGNDYLIKPVNVQELVERIEKNCEKNQKKLLTFQQFVMDEAAHAVYRRWENGESGEQIELSPTEYKLLAAFVQRQDEILLYKELYRMIWEQGEVEDTRALMVHVSNLRKKVDMNQNNMIRSVRGVGYIFNNV